MGISKMRASRLASLMVSSGSSRKSFETIGIDLRSVGADGLVAGLHVGEVHVGDEVGEEREEAVPELVTEEEGPPAPRRRRSASRRPRRPRSSTKTFTMRTRSRGWYSRSASWMTGDRAVRLGERGADGRALAAVQLVAEEDPLEVPVVPRARSSTPSSMGPLSCQAMPRSAAKPEDLGGRVAGAVVHDDHLDALEVRRALEHLQPRQRGRDQVLLVVDRDQDGERGHGRQGCTIRPGRLEPVGVPSGAPRPRKSPPVKWAARSGTVGAGVRGARGEEARGVSYDMKRKGIILAGGAGTRLYPATLVGVEAAHAGLRQADDLLPAHGAHAGGIREILVISTPQDTPRFAQLLGDGARWGVALEYAVQPEPGRPGAGVHHRRDFVAGGPSALVLGDNIFYGHELPADRCSGATSGREGATVFAYAVHDPERYGVVEFDGAGGRSASRRSPRSPKSHYAVTGLYFYDEQVVEHRARGAGRRARGELEITDLNRALSRAAASSTCELMGRGYAWLDTGTHESLLEAAQFIAHHREAAGAEGRLPGGDRLAAGLDRRPRSSSAGRGARQVELRRSTCAASSTEPGVLMKVTPTAIPDVAAHRAQRVRRRPRLLLRELQQARSSRPPWAVRSSSCRTTIEPRRRACCAGCTTSSPQPQGKLVRVVRGRDVRRRGRHAPRLADLRALGRRGAVARRTSASSGFRRASPTASSSSPTRPSSCTRPPTTGAPSTSAASAGTIPSSRSRGRLGGAARRSRPRTRRRSSSATRCSSTPRNLRP